MLNEALQYAKCRLGGCVGNVISAWDDTGRLWMAWQCAERGCIKHADLAYPPVTRRAAEEGE